MEWSSRQPTTKQLVRLQRTGDVGSMNTVILLHMKLFHQSTSAAPKVRGCPCHTHATPDSTGMRCKKGEKERESAKGRGRRGGADRGGIGYHSLTPNTFTADTMMNEPGTALQAMFLDPLDTPPQLMLRPRPSGLSPPGLGCAIFTIYVTVQQSF